MGKVRLEKDVIPAALFPEPMPIYCAVNDTIKLEIELSDVIIKFLEDR